MSHVKIISERQPVTDTYYKREFQLIGESWGTGLSFPCDDNGEPDLQNNAAKTNFQYALEHPEEYEDLGRQEYRHTYVLPALAKCSCGHEIRLSSDYNVCDCGQGYNLFGQALLPMEEWENF